MNKYLVSYKELVVSVKTVGDVKRQMMAGSISDSSLLKILKSDLRNLDEDPVANKIDIAATEYFLAIVESDSLPEARKETAIKRRLDAFVKSVDSCINT